MQYIGGRFFFGVSAHLLPSRAPVPARGGRRSEKSEPLREVPIDDKVAE